MPSNARFLLNAHVPPRKMGVNFLADHGGLEDHCLALLLARGDSVSLWAHVNVTGTQHERMKELRHDC